MRIAILSDIHDNVWKLAAALDGLRSCSALICCGDLCSPFVVHQLARGFEGPIHLVFGNNDGDLFRIASNATKYGHVNLHGELFVGEFDGKRFAVNHYDGIGREIAASGRFDVVCYGHNHIYEVRSFGKTLGINPGPVMGAAIDAGGSWRTVPSTYVVYDTGTGSAERVEVG
jgi:putative phosphoesterase